MCPTSCSRVQGQCARSRCFLEPNIESSRSYPERQNRPTTQTPSENYLKEHCEGTGLTVTFVRNLGYVPTWALPPLARHRMKSSGQYSIMLCARAGSNTELQHSGFRFLHSFWESLAEAAMHKYASVAGSGHGCGSSRMQHYDLPCSCGANECLPSNSVTGSSAKSERSLGLGRYFVKVSATFLSPPIFFPRLYPNRSCPGPTAFWSPDV